MGEYLEGGPSLAEMKLIQVDYRQRILTRVLTKVPDDSYYVIKAAAVKAYPTDEDKKDLFQKALAGQVVTDPLFLIPIPVEYYRLNTTTYYFEKVAMPPLLFSSKPMKRITIMESLKDEPLKTKKWENTNHSTNTRKHLKTKKNRGLGAVFPNDTDSDDDLPAGMRIMITKPQPKIKDKPLKSNKRENSNHLSSNKGTVFCDLKTLKNRRMGAVFPTVTDSDVWPAGRRYDENLGTFLLVVECTGDNVYDAKVLIMPGKYTEEPVTLAMLMKLFNPLYYLASDNLTEQEAEDKRNSSLVDAHPKEFYGPQVVDMCIAVWLSLRHQVPGMIINKSDMIRNAKPVVVSNPIIDDDEEDQESLSEEEEDPYTSTMEDEYEEDYDPEDPDSAVESIGLDSLEKLSDQGSEELPDDDDDFVLLDSYDSQSSVINYEGFLAATMGFDRFPYNDATMKSDNGLVLEQHFNGDATGKKECTCSLKFAGFR